MEAVSPYTVKFACWEYQTHLYPHSKAPGAKELNRVYRNWIEGGEETETDRSQTVHPWTHLNWNDSDDKFQFLILPDRTGTTRPGVFEEAIEKINLLQPEFVVSVGDLIQGGIKDQERINNEWNEFNGLINELEMPFFYVPGNHDYSNDVMAQIWKQKYGRSYHHFVYKEVLFLCLNSEGEVSRLSGIDSLQYEYFQHVLEENSDVKWTFLFMHQPVWHYNNTPYWHQLEETLINRKYTVFAGHTHQYKKETKLNNTDYIILATAGGIGRVRGVDYGEFDHLSQVSFNGIEPVIANIMLDGVMDKNVVTGDMYPLIFADRVYVEPVFYEDTYQEGNMEVTISNDADYSMKTIINYCECDPYSSTNSDHHIDVEPNSSVTRELPIRLLPSDGENDIKATALKFSYQYDYKAGRTLHYEQQIRIGPLKKVYIKKTDSSIKVDGKLKEWTELPYRLDAGSATGNDSEDNISCDFSLTCDESNLYLALSVFDDDIHLKPGEPALSQNGVLVSIDPRPVHISSNGRMDNIFSKEIFRLFFVPKLEKEGELLFDQQESIPGGTHVVSKRSENGFDVELSIPMEYLDSFNDNQWESIRLNIAYTDVDKNEKRSIIWWKPNWSSTDNYIGSGTFFRTGPE